MKSKLSQGNCLALAIALLSVLLCASAGLAQTTSFTYQGRLSDGGTAANGNYDLQFALFDSLSGGTQIGSTQTKSSVSVSNGTFTVSLDFGASSFNGANRFLEISARLAGGGAFTILSPRQQVTATPYAIRSVNASSADNATTATTATTATNATQLGGVAASQYVQTNDSRLSDSRPPSPGSSNYIQNTNSQQSGVTFNVSGDGTVGGTLTGNIVNAGTQFNIGGNRVLSVGGVGDTNTLGGIGAGGSNTGGANSFFGSDAGGHTTTGSSNSFFGSRAGLSNTQGTGNSYFGQDSGGGSGGDNSSFGISAGLSKSSGSDNSFFGSFAGENDDTGSFNTMLGHRANPTGNLINATAVGACANVTQSNSLILGSIANAITSAGCGQGAVGDTNVGIGITAPVFRLHVVDPGAAGLRVQTNTGGGAVASFGGNGDFQIDSNGVTGGRFIVQQGGNVGIGTASPDNKLTVNGTADKPGGGSWGTFSDERLKNLKGRFTSGLSAVMRLQPLRYEYRRDNALGIKSEGEYVGFSAQAVQKIIPEAVSKDDKGFLLVNNDPILWTMLNAIKEQQAQIERQQNQIEALRKLACRSHRHAAVCK